MGGPRSQRTRRRPRAERPSERPSREGRGGAAKPRLKELCELSSFSVFCALYLGIAQDDSYAPAGADTVRRRFDLSDAEFKDYLETHGLTGEDVRRASFDVESACFDIEVAPSGISRTELARTLFAEFCAMRDAFGDVG